LLEPSILKSFRAGIIAIDPEGRVLYINEIGRKILDRFPIAEGMDIRSLSGENAFFRVLVEALDLHYLPSRIEVDFTNKAGERRFVGFTLSELIDADRRIGICAFFKDLTLVEMAEENENLNQRLRLLGQMAAGLAHEIRNPIASIGVHCGILRMRLQNEPRLLSSVQLMEGEINHIEYIIRECLNFVRPDDLGLRQILIRELLSRVTAQTAKLYKGVEIVLQSDGVGDPEIEADEGLLEQALLNIVSNAAQACEGKGKVETTYHLFKGYRSVVPEREPYLPHELGSREEILTISVKDNGIGIPREIREKIFVPFFTTKKEGTGIGLPLAQKIIYAHKGVIDVISEEGKGTEFLIKIPVRQSRD
jgi:signal transduction histidine kinase